MKNKSEKYLRYLYPPNLFKTERTKEILAVNPTVIPVREEAAKVEITAYVYDKNSYNEYKNITIDEVLKLKENDRIAWINVDGLKRQELDKFGEIFGIHPLFIEDVLSVNQRPKTDEIDDILFTVMNMLYYEESKKALAYEQISLVLGKNFVITFQEFAGKDVFDALRERLKGLNSRTRTKKADYLYYTLLDAIVDQYFIVMEKLGEEIENLEEEIVKNSTTRSLAQLSILRKELIVLKRSIYPVREVMGNILKTDSDFICEESQRYFKNVYDHVIQAIDLAENYRDIIISMQDLYLNKVNLKMNEVMKVMAIVTCLLAPATVIGGMFGMNFDVIPLSKHYSGFWIAVSSMLLIPIGMLYLFKKRGWY
jgi:magnesium transporter